MTAVATSGFRQALGRVLTVTITLLVCGAAAAAVIGGFSLITAEGDAAPGVAAPRTSVGVMSVEMAQGYTVTRRFTGQIEAAARTDLGFELGGRVTEVLVEEGDAVAAGSVLARLDTSALNPERAALEAELAVLAADAELARLTLARNDALTERGFRSVAAQDDARLSLARAEAGMAAVRARIAGVDVRLEKSVLRAPFAARIGARLADPGQTAAAGQTVLVLFDTNPARARIGLPPEMTAGLTVGDRVSVELGGAELDATLRQIRPDLDPNTRSRSVVVTLPQGAAPVLGDTVALLLMQTVNDPGFWAPLSALREGVRGSWSVMALEATADGDRTLPAAVEVIHSDGARVFLRGALPPRRADRSRGARPCRPRPACAGTGGVMRMDTLFFRQPRLVMLALLVILSAGMSALVSIGRQEDPTITNIFATITTVFPGADPAPVEALVTAKIETELRTIPEIATVESTSATGISVISVELVETVPPETIEQLWAQVRDALADAQREFPAGVLEPEFDSDGAGGYAAIFALTMPEGFSLTRAAREAEALADRLRRVAGTSLVDLHGLPEEEVLVTLHPDRTAALGLTADEVSAAIRAADAKVQAGRLRGEETDLVLGITGEITSLDRLRAVVLREDADGRVTLLGDVAQITRGPRLPLAEAALFQGKPAILVSAKLSAGLQVDRWMTGIRAAAATQAEALPWGLSIQPVFDQSRYTLDRLAEVGMNMLVGVALVVVVLFVTLGWRAALIVAMVLPVVSLASVATLNALAVPIHQMSVTGLIVALGLLVDAAIVMTDEVGKRLREGLARLQAVAGAVRRLTMPLAASTITTILSFLPLLLLPGPAGDFVGSIAISVIVMLAWSFVVAVTITPAIAGRWLRMGDGAPARDGVLMRGFRAVLTLSMANPLRTLALSLVLPVIGFLSLPTLTPQFFPGVDRDQFHIEIDLPPGTGIAETMRIVREIDARLTSDADILDVAWVVGRSAPAFYYNMVGDRDQAPAFAQALIRTASPAATARLLIDLQTNLPPAFLQARFVIRSLTQGPPVNAPVELRLVGQDIDALRLAGDDLRARLAEVSTVAMVRTGIAGGSPKLTLEIDEARARLLGLDLGQVARQMEAGLEGVTGGSLLEGTEELPVRVRLGAGLRGDPVAIGDMPILPPKAAAVAGAGQFPAVPLSTLGRLRLEPSESTITRRNGERVNTVQAFLMPGILPALALAEATALLEAGGYAPPQGIRLETGGDSDARNSTVDALIAPLGLIITLSIAVVVMTFNSFRLTLIAFTVAGLSAGLSMLALAIFDYPFGINAIIGVIGSIGVSINAALIVLSGLQEDPRAASGDRAAMVDVVAGSARHITSTTITTVGGFLPLILGGGGFWPPFAMSVAGGVALSVTLAFAFTPQMFALTLSRRRPDVGHAADVSPKTAQPRPAGG